MVIQNAWVSFVEDIGLSAVFTTSPPIIRHGEGSPKEEEDQGKYPSGRVRPSPIASLYAEPTFEAPAVRHHVGDFFRPRSYTSSSSCLRTIKPPYAHVHWRHANSLAPRYLTSADISQSTVSLASNCVRSYLPLTQLSSTFDH